MRDGAEAGVAIARIENDDRDPQAIAPREGVEAAIARMPDHDQPSETMCRACEAMLPSGRTDTIAHNQLAALDQQLDAVAVKREHAVGGSKLRWELLTFALVVAGHILVS